MSSEEDIVSTSSGENGSSTEEDSRPNRRWLQIDFDVKWHDSEKKERSKVEYEGKLYRFDAPSKKVDEDEIPLYNFYKCDQKGCSGRLWIVRATSKLRFEIGKHTCEDQSWRVGNADVRDKQNALIRANVDTPGSQVVQQSMERLSNVQKLHTPCRKSMIQRANKQSRKYLNLPAEPKDFRFEAIPDTLKNFADGSLFLLYDSGPLDAKRMVVWGDSMFDVQHVVAVFGDGTFASCALQHRKALPVTAPNTLQGGLRKGTDECGQSDIFELRMTVIIEYSICISKKRVLGQCNKCMKPVTAGARQMHMFFHLGKDHDTYRFRCKHPGCTVEHYRKDQMENHQAKTHKKVDLDMMEDRSLELHSLCQKMSMELLGTIGNTPGPTAEKAQILYDKMQEDAEMSALRKRRRGANGGVMNPSRSHSYFGNNRNFLNNSASQYHRSSFQQSPPVKRPLDPRQRINEENLECLLCHKYIMNRIRGFHILWHLNNDLGIIRYNCKFCDYKHDRPQSVTTHGKKSIMMKTVWKTLFLFEDEVKSMSKACFGVEQLFAKEVRRKRMEERNERALQAEQELLGISLNMGNTTDSGLEELHDMETNSNDTNFNDMVQLGGSASKTKNSSYVLSPKEKARSSGGAASSSQSSVQKTTTARKSTRRFGMRRPKSRKQKIEMAKLREISMRLGGAQYFKKKSTDSIPCEKCGKFNSSRLSDHAYSHLLKCELFLCPQCNLGHQSRDMILKHLRDFHSSNEQPTDNRLKFAQEIKDAIRECYPSCFVDAPIPTAADIERLKANLNLSDKALACATFENDNEEEEKGSDNGEDDEEPDDNESSNSKSNEAKSSKIEDEDDDAIDDEEEQLQIQEGDVEENEEEQEEDDEEETMDADEEEPEESAVNGEEDE